MIRATLALVPCVAALLLAGCQTDEMRRDFVAARYVQQAEKHLQELPRDSARATAELDRAVALLPEGHEMSLRLARLYVLARDYDAAAELFEALPEVGRHDRTLLAYCLLQTGRREAGTRMGLEVIEEADRLHSSGAVTRSEWALLLNDAAYLLIDGGADLDVAHDALRRAVEAFPLDSPIVDSWGWALLHRGELMEAAFYLERAQRHHPGEDPEMLYHLGVVYSRLDRIGDARRALKRAAELDPGFEPAQKELRRLGRILPPPNLALTPGRRAR